MAHTKPFMRMFKRSVLYDDNTYQSNAWMMYVHMLSFILNVWSTCALHFGYNYDYMHYLFLYHDMQLWSNVRSAFGDKSDMMEAADKLFKSFESLYEQEVCGLAIF